MSPDLKPGMRFEWRYAVPARTHERHVIDPLRFAAKAERKRAAA